jgi:hypothetical protein
MSHVLVAQTPGMNRNQEKDARLIAAAPTMREALQACVDVIPPDVEPSPARSALHKAQAALELVDGKVK